MESRSRRDSSGRSEPAHGIEPRSAERLASLYDPLTDLPNRYLFDDRLEYSLAQAARFGWSLALLHIDVNGFRSINESHGHAVGDMVLQDLSKRLKASVREADTVSRYTDDDFLCLVTGTIVDPDVNAIARKFVTALATPVVVHAGNGSLNLIVGVSVGITIYPRYGSTPAALMQSASAAMQRAKRSGLPYSFA